MARILVVMVGVLCLGACTQRMICPAYQSAYIYDKEELRKKFSYFKEDSTPKILTASKNKYLIAVPESYRKKVRSLATVEMKPVYPEVPDSLKMEEGSEFMLAEREFVDSAALVTAEAIEPGDSAYAITKTKEKYNVDQDNYMWYFRDILVLPDVRAALEQKKDNGDQPGKSRKKEGGFFKNLFKKKQKTDSASVDGAALPADEDGPPRRKGLFGKKKKAGTEEPNNPPKKEEDDQEGFD